MIHRHKLPTHANRQLALLRTCRTLIAVVSIKILQRKGSDMKRMISVFHDESGLTTAEYAVGTCAAAGLGGLLLKILTSSQVADLIVRVISHAFSFIFG